MKLEYTDDAELDIIGIGRRIAIDHEQTASDFLRRMRKFIESLRERATVYRIRTEWGRSVRAANFHGYLIFFEVDDTTVTVLRVASGKRDIARVLRESLR